MEDILVGKQRTVGVYREGHGQCAQRECLGDGAVQTAAHKINDEQEKSEDEQQDIWYDRHCFAAQISVYQLVFCADRHIVCFEELIFVGGLDAYHYSAAAVFGHFDKVGVCSG